MTTENINNLIMDTIFGEVDVSPDNSKQWL
jgi:hypothetical protein